MTLPGSYAFRFTGYNREDTFARRLAGLGVLELESTGGPNGRIRAGTGEQFATSTPMFGDPGNRHLHGRWVLTGTYRIVAAGPPIRATATIKFVRQTDGQKEMTNTYIILQTGPDRLTVMSRQPREDADDDGNVTGRDVHELSMIELIKVDPTTW